MTRLIVLTLLYFFTNLFSVHAQNLVPFKTEKHKWGYKNKAGKIVLPAIYDAACDFSEGLAAVNKGGKKYLEDGTMYADFEGGKWGFIDLTGKLIIPYQFDTPPYYNYKFVNGFARVISKTEVNEKAVIKWGFINKKGTLVVPFKYTYVNDYSDGLALININGFNDGYGGIEGGTWGCIDKEGKEVIEPKYSYISSFNNGLAVMKFSGKYGFINNLGLQVIEPIYLTADNFKEGLAKVSLGTKENPKYGFIDLSGKEIVEIMYDAVDDFSEGLAAINMDGKWERISKYTQEMQLVDGKWGYVDKTGKIIITCKYKKAAKFIKGKAEVELNGQNFYIDKNGNGIDE